MNNYKDMQANLAKGWNTWNTYNVMAHVLMPEAFAISLGLKDNFKGGYLIGALTGQYDEKNNEKIRTQAHEYDGSYTELSLSWKGNEILVQSAVEDEEIVILVTPLDNPGLPATLFVQGGMLWNCKGIVQIDGDLMTAELPGKSINIYTTGTHIKDPYIPVYTPFFTLSLQQPVGISTGKRRSLEEIREIIYRKQLEYNENKNRFGELAEVYNAMKNGMAWNTIYEPQKGRVVSPVSRVWNYGNGYRLFCWDNYFAGYMASVDSKEVAYANVVEITREKVKDGFVPNAIFGNGFKTIDRSQPPVGSMVVRELYRKFHDNWFLEEIFDDLYTWNRWFLRNRGIGNGWMAWGSNSIKPEDNYPWSTERTHNRQGAAYESGLDNSPMYDDIPFDSEKNQLKLADVGLTGLYIMDCNALADIAEVIGRKAEAKELRQSADKSNEALQLLWDEETGIFLNKRTDTGEFSKRISPTNFYALLSDSVTEYQAWRMLKEHFYNPDEFWGDFIMPSISRNDPAYTNQHSYWRGRIWGPMNFLVYLGLRKHNLADACKDLAEKSRKLLMQEWDLHRHIHENYCGDTGLGCVGGRSSKFYHWGGLLALINLIEAGYVEGPEKPL